MSDQTETKNREPHARTGYTIRPARYAKNMMAVACPSDGSGYKTRAAYLCGALNGRYVGRENAYLMSPTKAKRFEALFAGGWDATGFGTLIPPKPAA